MKMKNLIGALLVAVVTCLAMPAIATPPDSPPKAQPAFENLNAFEAPVLTIGEYRVVAVAPDIQRVTQFRHSELSNDAIRGLTGDGIQTLVYHRSPDARRYSTLLIAIRPMTPAPPGRC